MAEGFKVADAYISVHTDDDTRKGRDKIEKDTESWARKMGRTIGNLFGLGIARGLAGALMKILGGLFQISKWLVIAAAIGAVVQAVGALGVALIQASAASALAVPGLLALVSVFAALKVAVSGFGEAVKQAWAGGDLEKLNAAMAKLAPSAQAAVKEIVKLKPALETFKKVVQESFFKNLASDIQVLGAVYLPILQQHLAIVAGIFGDMIHDVTRFFASPQVVADWISTFGALQGVVRNIAAGMLGILDGFRHIGTVAAPILRDLTSGFGAWAGHFAAVLAEMRESGRLDEIIRNGVAVLGQLFDLLVAVFQVIGPIFQAINAAGGGVLTLMIDLAHQLAAFLSSAPVQNAIIVLFQTLNAVLTAIMPGLAAVLGALGTAIIALAPALTILGQVFGQTLVAIAPALSVAAVAIGQILVALTPLIPLFAQFVVMLVDLLAPILVAVAPLITQLFVALAPLIPPVLALIQALAQAILPLLPPLVQLITLFAQFLVPVILGITSVLGPLLAQLGGALLKALLKILPPLLHFAEVLFDALLPTFLQLLPVIVQLAEILLSVFTEAFIALLPVLETLLPVIGELALAILPVLVPLFQSLADLIIALLPFLIPVIELFAKLAISVLPFIIVPLTGVIKLLVWVQNIINSLIAPVAAFLGKLIGLTNSLFDLGEIFEFVRKGWEAFETWVKNIWNSLWDRLVSQPVQVLKKFFKETLPNYIRDLPSNLLLAMVQIAGDLLKLGWNIVSGIWEGIVKATDWFKGKLREWAKAVLPDWMEKILGIGSPSKVMAAVAKWIPAGMAQGMLAGIGQIQDAATQLAAAAMPVLAPVNMAASISTAANGGAGGGQGGSQAPVFLVDLGNGVMQAVTAVLTRDPEKIAAGTLEGSRQRDFLNPGRAGAFS